jgi:hypothetical protein
LGEKCFVFVLKYKSAHSHIPYRQYVCKVARDTTAVNATCEPVFWLHASTFYAIFLSAKIEVKEQRHGVSGLKYN